MPFVDYLVKKDKSGFKNTRQRTSEREDSMQELCGKIIDFLDLGYSSRLPYYKTGIRRLLQTKGGTILLRDIDLHSERIRLLMKMIADHIGDKHRNMEFILNEEYVFMACTCRIRNVVFTFDRVGNRGSKNYQKWTWAAEEDTCDDA